MKRNSIFFKTMTIAVMTAAISVFAACGSENTESAENTENAGAVQSADSGNAYLEDINVKDYVKLGEYKGLEIAQTKPEISDEYRDTYINYLLSLNPEEGTEEGDTVNIDYVGTKDGVAFDGGTAQGYELTIGSGQFIDGFEDGLVGAKAGDVVELDLKFPADYHSEDLAGQAVVFTVTVNAISAATPRELTDEYVQSLGISCSTVDEYKEYVYNQLMEQEQIAYEERVEGSLASTVVEKSEFIKDLPQEMIDRYAETLTVNLTSEAANYGKTLDEFMQLYYGMDAATYKEEIKTQSTKSAKQYVVLKAIADEENLNVTEEELQKEMETMASDAGYESVDEFKKLVNDRGYKEFMMGQNVMDMLRENAVISEE